MAMAATALINPSTSYYAHSPYSSSGGYHSSAPTPPSTLSGLISPVDSRRTSDDDMAHQRQSLPSIQEVIGKGAPSYSNSAPPTSLPTPSLPSPFGPPSSARSFSTEASSDRQPSPHGPHHPIPPPPSSASSIYNPRPDSMSTGYPGSMRSQPPPPPPPPSQQQQHLQHPPQQQQQQQQPPSLPPPLSGRLQPRGPPPSPPPSMESHAGLSSYHHQQPPPPPPPSMQSSQQQQHQPSQHHQQQQQHQSQPPHPHLPHQQHQQQHQPPPPHQAYHHSASQDPKPQHAHSPPHLNIYPSSSNANAYGSQSSAQQPLPPPPGQMPPLSASYPVSPRHSGPPSLPSPYEAHQQTPVHEGSPDFGRSRTRYDQTVSRHFEAWNYSEYLSKIGSNARTIFNFADAFGSIVREEHGSQPIAGRMPSEREVCDMINNADWLKIMLENLRKIIQQTVVNERSGPGSANRQKPYEEMDTVIYGESMAVKKRRGRAAPPGRCHSCNRIDTPEWRRGPDGARTLCNACGLHYAKLERKKQLESRAIRPNAKHPDERH